MEISYLWMLLYAPNLVMIDSSKNCGAEAWERFVDSLETLVMCLFGVISMAFLISQGGFMYNYFCW